MAEIDDVLSELAALEDQLLAADEDDFALRFELRQRQEELRARARTLSVDQTPESEEQLRRKLEHLKHRRDEHLATRLPQSSAAQTGMGGGIDPGYVHEMNQAMAETFGLGELETEIRRLEEELARYEDAD